MNSKEYRTLQTTKRSAKTTEKINKRLQISDCCKKEIADKLTKARGFELLANIIEEYV